MGCERVMGYGMLMLNHGGFSSSIYPKYLQVIGSEYCASAHKITVLFPALQVVYLVKESSSSAPHCKMSQSSRIISQLGITPVQ